MEIKATSHFIKSITDRTVTGIFAVHGNVDSGFDRSHPGSFSRTLQENAKRIRFLWQHDASQPPIARVDSMREISREELPIEILNKAPEATGGVEVTRTYLATPRGDEVLTAIKDGALNEMSYAYDAVHPSITKMPDGTQIRELNEVRLYEASDVNWGMNAATVGAKCDDIMIARFASYIAEFKAGARHSASDMALLNEIVANALKLGADNAKLISADDAAKDDTPNATPALVDITSLRDQMQLFRLKTL